MTKKKFENNKKSMAVLLSFNHKTKKQLYTEFEGKNSVNKAQGLLNSIKDDFPDSTFLILRNAKAVKEFTDKMLGIKR